MVWHRLHCSHCNTNADSDMQLQCFLHLQSQNVALICSAFHAVMLLWLMRAHTVAAAAAGQLHHCS
jgi:hypothetical protein